MAAKLVFNIERIHQMSDELGKRAEDLMKQNNDLLTELDQLKNDWNTPAGKKFFKEIDIDWTKGVNDYCDTIRSLQEMLNESAAKYQNYEEEIGTLVLS